MSQSRIIVSQHEAAPGSLRTYLTGFSLSIGLTLLAYLAVVNHWTSRQGLIGFIIGLAVIQFVVQLVFFLHLGRESRPRWNLLVFGLMLTVLFILVLGSLWIMDNLDYHHASLTPAETANSIIRDEGYKP